MITGLKREHSPKFQKKFNNEKWLEDFKKFIKENRYAKYRKQYNKIFDEVAPK